MEEVCAGDSWFGNWNCEGEGECGMCGMSGMTRALDLEWSLACKAQIHNWWHLRMPSKEAEALCTEIWELEECTLLETKAVKRFQRVGVIWGVKCSREIQKDKVCRMPARFGKMEVMSYSCLSWVRKDGDGNSNAKCWEMRKWRQEEKPLFKRSAWEEEKGLEANWRGYFECRVGMVVLSLGLELV